MMIFPQNAFGWSSLGSNVPSSPYPSHVQANFGLVKLCVSLAFHSLMSLVCVQVSEVCLCLLLWTCV